MKREVLYLNTFGTDKHNKTKCDLVEFNLVLKNGNYFNVQALTHPQICSPVDTKINLDNYSCFKCLDLAENGKGSNNKIDILLGSDYYWELMTGEIIRSDIGLVAVESKLGWLITGKAEGHSGGQFNTHLILAEPIIHEHQLEETDLIHSLHKFWDVETFGVKHDEQGPATFLSDIQFDTSAKRYEIALPWKQQSFPEYLNLNNCVSRLHKLHSRLKVDKSLLHEYNKTIQQQLDTGIIEKEMNKTDVHYLPHRGVIKMERETTKLRIVFDGSAKDSYGLSINDRLETGPNLTSHIFDILISFRNNPISLSADIEKAFHQISIKDTDRSKLRFLWFEDSDSIHPQTAHFQFCRLVFGLISSPAILNTVIHHHLDTFADTYAELINHLKESIYVDDLVTGSSSEEDAYSLYEKLKGLLLQGGFNLRKWHTNNEHFRSKLNELENSEYQEEIKILGLNWNTDKDTFHFNFQEIIHYGKNLPITKRSVLKLAAKIYDPLGFLCPFTIYLKILFQKLCIDKTDWDTDLDSQLHSWWKKLFVEFEILEKIQVPRFYNSSSQYREKQIHGFCDSSNKTMAAVLYFRFVSPDESVNIKIICAKTKVAPIKSQTIPRLELLGALLLSRLTRSICKALSIGDGEIPIYLWTDSFTCLCWIKNNKQWSQYVQHRVEEIHKLSSSMEWRFCPGNINPADIPSRSCTANQLLENPSWWNGPEFLKNEEIHWPNLLTSFENTQADTELIKHPKEITHLLVNIQQNNYSAQLSDIIDINRYSKYRRLLRVTATVLKFIRLVRRKPNITPYISNEDEIEAETLWIKCVQHNLFPQEIHCLQHERGTTTYISQFDLFFDERNVIRCGGRIGSSTAISENAKHPIFLPASKQHRFVKLLIYEKHKETLHQASDITLNALRQTYWIIHGGSSTKSVLRHCYVCKRHQGKPYKTPKIPELPFERVSDSPPFTYTGLDFAGPLLISSKHSVEKQKVYICLYTCASTRAIHLELTEDLTVEAFNQSFRRFSSRRGLPLKLFSDNAKTYKKASKEITKILSSEKVRDFLTKQRVTWEFIVEKAPWWGGFWERMVQTTKRCIRKSLGRLSINFEEMRTLLVEVETVINNRPLTYMYDDENGVSYAPSHLIYGRNMTKDHNYRQFEISSTYKTLTRKMKHHFRLLENFTNSWKNEYLLSMREISRTKSIKDGKNNIKVGDIVILKDEKTARCLWKIAKITEIFPGSDGVIRSAAIKVKSSENRQPTTLRRPIQHLIPLEITNEQYPDIN